MSRSLKKGPFVVWNLLRKLECTSKDCKKREISTWSRCLTIVPIIIECTIAVHNGREHLIVFITGKIVGHKMGEFASTRTFCGHIKLDKKIKRLYSLWDKKFIQLVFDWGLLISLFPTGMKKKLIVRFLLKRIDTFAISCVIFTFIVQFFKL